MGKPRQVVPGLVGPQTPVDQPQPPDAAQGAINVVTADFTASWDQLRAALGQAVPHNVNRARSSASRFTQAVK